MLLLDLKDPNAATLANGRPHPWRVFESLQLACGWTDPDFVPPLLKLLDDDPRYRLHAAACLIRYDKPDLNRRVAVHSKHQHLLGGGCFVESVTVQGMLEKYRQKRTMPSLLGAANLEDNLVALQNSDPESRLNAWCVLASHQWFVPWKEYGLDPTCVWRATRRSNASRIWNGPIVGVERARNFLALVRKDKSLTSREVKEITAARWRLGCDEEAPACRAILQSIVTDLADERDPDYAAYSPLYDLCVRPDFANLDLYRRLIGRPSSSLRDYGWLAIIALDHEESFRILETCWNEPSEQMLSDSYYIFRWIQSLGERKTAQRERWLDWLLAAQPKLRENKLDLPSWIDAISSMAGRDFGPSGRYIPVGFNKEVAEKTTKAILDWDSNQRGR
jgi:hypothetical protein